MNRPDQESTNLMIAHGIPDLELVQEWLVNVTSRFGLVADEVEKPCLPQLDWDRLQSSSTLGDRPLPVQLAEVEAVISDFQPLNSKSAVGHFVDVKAYNLDNNTVTATLSHRRGQQGATLVQEQRALAKELGVELPPYFCTNQRTIPLVSFSDAGDERAEKRLQVDLQLLQERERLGYTLGELVVTSTRYDIQIT